MELDNLHELLLKLRGELLIEYRIDGRIYVCVQDEHGELVSFSQPVASAQVLTECLAEANEQSTDWL